MKRKRINMLSCERARAFPIEKALEKLGHFPTKSTEKEAWFLSPFRSETQASFKVSKKLNRWYDHGEGKGGNVIDLICQINKCPVKEALQIIGQGETSFSFQQQQILCGNDDNQNKIVITGIKQLTHFALKDYLRSRAIKLKTALRYVKEVHYNFKDKSYFAIGFKNDSGGWELRNRYIKNSCSPKDITHIKNGNNKLIITEGMFDLLSILENNKNLELNHDFLILNSTAFVRKAMKVVDGYTHIELYLDNDNNGRQATKKLLAQSKNCIDKSALFTDFKDMNQWLIFDAKDDEGQKAQDVFLLPQKQSCFAPDGRKVIKR